MNKNFEYLGQKFQLQLLNSLITDTEFANSIIEAAGEAPEGVSSRPGGPAEGTVVRRPGPGTTNKPKQHRLKGLSTVPKCCGVICYYFFSSTHLSKIFYRRKAQQL